MVLPEPVVRRLPCLRIERDKAVYLVGLLLLHLWIRQEIEAVGSIMNIIASDTRALVERMAGDSLLVMLELFVFTYTDKVCIIILLH